MIRRRIPVVLAAAGVLIALTACGGDDDDDTAATEATTASAEASAPAATAPAAGEPAADGPDGTEPAGSEPTGSVDPEYAEYCALSIELDEQQSLPTAEQMTTILAAAPEEIADAAKTFVDAYVAAGEDAMTVFLEHEEELAVIEAFDAEHCGIVSEEEAPPDPEVVTIDPAATRVDVEGTDFHFEFEPPTAAGRYSFVMTNDGEEPHMMILAQMEPGATFDEVMASEGEEGLVQSFESIAAVAGEEAVVTADLSAGHWILVCPIPSGANDMQPHAALGMVHEWDVT
ncbi:MAG: hypothetical protein ABW195_08785 [Ilumatobacteraceae bacterium]